MKILKIVFGLAVIKVLSEYIVMDKTFNTNNQLKKMHKILIFAKNKVASSGRLLGNLSVWKKMLNAFIIQKCSCSEF